MASNFIRKTSVDQARKLDLIGCLQNSIKTHTTIDETKQITIGLSNDGYSEALGRLILDKKHFIDDSFKWVVLKLGSGTAGVVFNNKRIFQGLSEFGKLVQNVFSQNGHSTGNCNSLPDGLMNLYASGRLLPLIYNSLNISNDTPNSYEIGLLVDYIISDTNNSTSSSCIYR